MSWLSLDRVLCIVDSSTAPATTVLSWLMLAMIKSLGRSPGLHTHLTPTPNIQYTTLDVRIWTFSYENLNEIFFFEIFQVKGKLQWMKTWRLIPSAKLGYCAKEMRIKGLFYPLYSNLSGERTWCDDVGHNGPSPPSLDMGSGVSLKCANCSINHQAIMKQSWELVRAWNEL